jgi:ADP-ribosylglycohydrolase
MDKRNQNHFRGCLIGGAIGDALGWPVEFMKLEQIKHLYGVNGITELVLASNGKAEITDDTQMTMFTAEGLLRAEVGMRYNGISDKPTVIYHAYQRWMLTQKYTPLKEYNWIYDGWLLNLKELHARRGPGNTCLSALRSQTIGSVDKPINNSKGCGAIMRSGPFGLLLSKENAFEEAVESGALTHGHPSGYLAAGAFAYMIAAVIEGQDLKSAIAETMNVLNKKDGSDECMDKIQLALDLVERNHPDQTAIQMIGEGWVAEETLGIAVYCAIKHRDDFKRALIAAVNHDGDSDSTGAVTGNILGAYLGIEAIPENWVKNLELSEAITQLSDDLLSGFQEGEDWVVRYPGY